jgi:hypothetical protein
MILGATATEAFGPSRFFPPSLSSPAGEPGPVTGVCDRGVVDLDTGAESSPSSSNANESLPLVGFFFFFLDGGWGVRVLYFGR